MLKTANDKSFKGETTKIFQEFSINCKTTNFNTHNNYS